MAKMWVNVMENMFSDGLTPQLMIWEGYSKIWQLEKLVDRVGKDWWEWVGLELAGFARFKDWQSQSIIWKGQSKIWQLKQLGDGVGGWFLLELRMGRANQ